jgi:EAL domain-containing protein (putative c-di-GMP-specific phosphodiesterase class I)
LEYLNRLPVATSRSTALSWRGWARSLGNEAVVRTIVARAKTLGLVVTAEGIETAE